MDVKCVVENVCCLVEIECEEVGDNNNEDFEDECFILSYACDVECDNDCCSEGGNCCGGKNGVVKVKKGCEDDKNECSVDCCN